MRNSISLNQNWKFSIKDQPAIDVNIPHTWNAIDGQDGGNDYYRGIGTYERLLQSLTLMPIHRMFIWNSVVSMRRLQSY